MIKGCLTVFWGLLLFLFLIGGLAEAPLFTIVVIGVVLGIILVQKFQRKKQAEVKRKRAIAEARQRPNLFKFDTSVGIGEIQNHEKARNPVAWAEALQRRYGVAEAALNDAMMVVNDDIEQLAVYREQLYLNVVQKYEGAIRPFKKDLLLSADQIPHPSGLVVAKAFSFPKEMQPKKIQKNLNLAVASTSQNISRYLLNKGGFSDLKRGDIWVIGIQVVVALIRQEKLRSEQLKELQKLQANIDVICVQIQGAIQVLGKAANEIQYLRQQHEETVQFMMSYYPTIKTLSRQGKSLKNLHETERQSVEAFYIAGKQLKRLLQIDVMKSE